MKYSFTTLLFVIASLSLQGQSNVEVIDQVVAQVGSELLLLSEVEDQFALANEQQKGALDDGVRCVILENALVQKLLVNQAILDSVVVNDLDVEAKVNFKLDRILSLMNNDENQFQSYYGKSVAEVRVQMMEPEKNQMMAEQVQGQIIRDVKITPSEVVEFFESVPKDSLPYYNSEVELGELIYTPKVNAGEKKKALEKLTKIKERIEAGEDFAELAATFSDDFGSSRQGGNLGWVKRGSFVPEFEAVAYALSKDELSTIVETEFGFHLIQLLERRGNLISARHILIRPKITDADLAKSRRLLDSVRILILRDSLTFGEAVKEYADEKSPSYSNGGRMINPQTRNTFFETKDIQEPDVFLAIDTMDLEGISAPIEIRDQRGDISYTLIQLQARSAPHKASLSSDYSRIQTMAKESKKALIFQEWVVDHIDETFVKLYPVYEGCPNMDVWNSKESK